MAVVAGLLLSAPQAAGGGASVDRLDRFRDLARARLATAGLLEAEDARGLSREVYDLLDQEILESLGSGGVFASEGFLQDRVDGFNEAWGGVALRVVRLGRVVAGTFHLGDATEGNSVRVYGTYRGEAVVLGIIHGDGMPALHPLPLATAEKPQFLVVWEGAPTGRGTTPLRIDLVRVGRDSLETVWGTAKVLGSDLQTWSHAVRGHEVRLRYELRYPGWVPGCEGQTEGEDLYRYVPARQTFTLVRRRLYSPWHRQFRAVVDTLFRALHAADGRVLDALVPDARVRAALPAALEPEPACDAPEGSPPAAVSVAATLGVERRPWALTFRRAGSAWRLASAAPVRRGDTMPPRRESDDRHF